TAAPSPKPSPAQSPAPAPASSAAPSPAPKAAAASSSLRNWIYGTATVLFLGFGFLYITDTRASIHQFFVVPSLRLLHVDAEEAHHAAIKYVKGLYEFGLHPRERDTADQTMGDLKVEVFGHILNSPVGTSAGIDKNADIPDPLFELGAAVVEVGGVTPKPQEGNPKPRVFRIPSQNALINRYGLNSEGAEHVAMVLRERVRQYAYDHGLGLDAEAERLVLDGEAGVPPGSLRDGKVLAVQVAKNKVTPDSDIAAVAKDYVTCVDHLAKYADVLVVNVSSPNTPGLRDLQATAPLTAILSSVVDSAKSISRKTKPAVMVKVSPDEDSDAQVEGICSAVWSSGVDGVIVGNTTKKRPDPVPQGYVMPANEEKLLSEVGGYSGPQMFERTLNLVKKYRSKLDLGPVEDESVKSTLTGASDQKPVLVSESIQANPSTSDLTANPIEASVQRDAQHLKPLTNDADKESQQPIVKV
ncbi:FMN-linked oxidoreductase, partial [Hortaea werneckii]